MSEEKYSFQKTYTLLPQSPLIHFQWEQPGAALRASEVKPKLDKYIAKRYGQPLPEHWKNEQSPTALKYKLRFSVEGESELKKLGKKTDYEIYFANMNDNKESNREKEKFGLWADHKMTVVCYDDGLMEFIKTIIGDFFVVSNFGTMQDKGFGCFIVKECEHTNKEISELLKQEYSAAACYMFNVNGGSQKDIFRSIRTVYNILKSGNPFSPKVNSLLFEYFEETYGIKSEKEWLYNRAEAEESAYVRALMGLSVNMGPLDKPTEISDANTDDETKIERAPSPIWFVVYKNKVFFVGRRIPENLYGAKFNFASADKKLRSGQISVPSLDVVGEDFIDKYLHFAAKRLQEISADGKLTFRISEVR